MAAPPRTPQERAAFIERHCSQMLSHFAALLAAARVGDTAAMSEAGVLVDTARLDAAAAGMRASANALCKLSAALRMDSALLDVGTGASAAAGASAGAGSTS